MVQGFHSSLVDVTFFLQRQRCAENSTYCAITETPNTVLCAGECAIKLPDLLPQL